MRLFWMLMSWGAGGVVFHELMYRRFTDGPGDFEFGGLITHAGVDMILLTVLLAVVGLVYTGTRGGS